MDVETKIKGLKTNMLEVDDMEITSTGNFNIPSGDKYVFQEDNTTTCELNGGILTVNTINEYSTGGVTIESVNIDAGVVKIPTANELQVTTINEHPVGLAGVTVETVLIDDGDVTLPATKTLKTDKIAETTASNGVEIANYTKLSANPHFISTMTAEPGAVTGNGTAYTCAFDTCAANVNIGTAFSVSTYKMTAPVTGLYDFDITLHFDAVTNAAALVDISLVVEVAGAATVVTWLGLGDPLAGTGDEFIIHAAKSLRLLATATVKVVCTITGEGADTCVIKAANSQFSGKLVTI